MTKLNFDVYPARKTLLTLRGTCYGHVYIMFIERLKSNEVRHTCTIYHKGILITETYFDNIFEAMLFFKKHVLEIEGTK